MTLTFARRDLRAQFKGTLLGFAWSMALPIATLVTYSIVFGLFFQQKAPPLGNGKDGPFPLYLFSGLVPWGMYAITLSTAIATLLGTGPLMKKIYFPAYASVFGTVLARLYLSIFEVGILVLGLLAFGNIGATWLLVAVWLPVFLVFVSSVSLMLAVWNVHLRDTNYLVGIALQLQFYMTPIIYQISIVKDWHGIPLRHFVTYQPMTPFVEVFRSLLYGLSLGPLRAWLAMVFWTIVMAGAASIVYRRRGLDLSEEM